MSTFKAIKFHLKLSHDKQNLTLIVISYEIYETRRRLVSKISYELTTRVRSSVYAICKHQRPWSVRGSSVGCASAWYADIRGFDPHVRQHSFVAIGHEIISAAILSLPLIQEGQLSGTAKECTLSPG